jgi:hypothetical protein
LNETDLIAIVAQWAGTFGSGLPGGHCSGFAYDLSDEDLFGGFGTPRRWGYMAKHHICIGDLFPVKLQCH